MKCLNCGTELNLEPTMSKCPSCGADLPDRFVCTGNASYYDKDSNTSEGPLGTFTVVVTGEYLNLYKKSFARIMLLGAVGMVSKYGKQICSLHKSEITEYSKKLSFTGKAKSFSLKTPVKTVTFNPAGGGASKDFTAAMDAFAAGAASSADA